MKKIVLLAALFCTLFCAQAFAEKRNITDSEEIAKVIGEYYPNLDAYYAAGVIDVDSLYEETLSDGSTKYDIKYKFRKNYYGQDEIDGVLKNEFPDVYAMKAHGVIKDVSVYRFVEKNTGKVLTNVAYNRNTDRKFEIGGFRHRNGWMAIR